MIDFQNVKIGYGSTPVLKQVTCRIEQGSSVGLVGPNGSGKTTFLKTILGLIKPLSGSMSIDQQKRYGYVPQVDEISALWPLTVYDVVAIALRSKRFFSRLSADDQQAILHALDQTGIRPFINARFSSLSGGQKQRAILAQALSLNPDVLLLDEPTRGLDVVVERDFMAMIKNLQTEKGMTLLLVTHTLQLPLNYCEQILLFNDQRVSASSSAELVQTGRLEEVYGIRFYHEEKNGVRWVIPSRLGR